MVDVLVCQQGDLKDGDVRIVAKGELEVGIYRHAGKYFAYQNRCFHQGGPVCEGVLIPKVEDVLAPDRTLLGQRFNEDEMHIVCPWHGYEYSIRSGFHQGNSRVRLRKAELTIRDGEIYVSV